MALNTALATYLAETGMTETEFAEEVNDAIGQLAGRRGMLTDRSVRRWLCGEVAWPQAKQRVALERVTGKSPEELGFVRRGKGTHPAPPEDPVRRRTFITASAGTAAVPLATATSPIPRIGSSDVDRLTAKLADLVASDNRHGGTQAVEARAVRLAAQTLDLQQTSIASQRVRGELYSLAAAFTSSAMWAAIDGRRLDEATQHLNKAVTLAGLSADPAVQFRVWGHAGALYRQLGRSTDALAADDAARSTPITRRDPLYASLAHARTAVHHADDGNTPAARRSLDHAQHALDRADPDAHRPPWMAFYDQAELELLALTTHLTLGRWAEAEAHAHRNLTLLRHDFQRNRALALAHLAHAQLGQDDLEPAVTTALKVPAETRHGRISGLLDAFGRRLTRVAPRAAETRQWLEAQAARTEKSTSL
ncbi:Tat pathway signal protein [Streptomyces phytophilus]|uniref:Tat pathway signal protein n=1 Tax=Streptomyces phytophilus TaxID=722715 RepID=UPI0015F05CA0|nr:Tat pathway signal protein [Streptomyces phytophilus]